MQHFCKALLWTWAYVIVTDEGTRIKGEVARHEFREEMRSNEVRGIPSPPWIAPGRSGPHCRPYIRIICSGLTWRAPRASGWCKCGNLILFFFILRARNFEHASERFAIVLGAVDLNLLKQNSPPGRILQYIKILRLSKSAWAVW